MRWRRMPWRPRDTRKARPKRMSSSAYWGGPEMFSTRGTTHIGRQPGMTPRSLPTQSGTERDTLDALPHGNGRRPAGATSQACWPSSRVAARRTPHSGPGLRAAFHVRRDAGLALSPARCVGCACTVPSRRSCFRWQHYMTPHVHTSIFIGGIPHNRHVLCITVRDECVYLEVAP